MNLEEQQISIDFKDLLSFQEQKDIKKSKQFNPFAQCFKNTQQIRKYQFKDKFTGQFPTIPMRRTDCRACLIQKVRCTDCQYCSTSPCCRQMLLCVYDYCEWINNKQDNKYKICDQCNRYLPSSSFEIDWILIRLVEKMGSRSPHSKYFMHVVGNFLWMTQENFNNQNQLTQQKSAKTIIKPSIFHKDNYGMFFCNNYESKNNSKLVGDYNIKAIQSLLKQNAKLVVLSKQTWEEDNLEQQCSNIIEKITEHQQMQKFKSKLQLAQDYNQYVNIGSIRQTKYMEAKQIGCKYSQNSQIIQKSYQYTHKSNERMMFCFCWQQGVLLIENANYETSPDFKNIRPIPIRLNQKTGISWQMMKKAVWFKDRKGDIFSFVDVCLYIYKYHLETNTFHQILINQNKIFEQVSHQLQLLYIPHTDRAYYFNAPIFQQSFYIELLRNQKVNHSCERINIVKDAFTNCSLFPFKQFTCYSLYAIQTVTFEKEGKKRKESLPVIYLLFYRSLSIISLPLGIHRLIHVQNQKQSICIFQNIGIKQSLNLSKRKINNFDEGLFFPLKMQGTLKLFFYCVFESKKTLIEVNFEGDIKVKRKQEKWDIIPYKISFSHEYLQFNKKYNIPAIGKSAACNQHLGLVLNDTAGEGNNNCIKYLGYQPANGQIVQFMITNEQGKLQWKLYDLP